MSRLYYLIGADLFQLHEGAIDTFAILQSEGFVRMFQLHEGAIDTPVSA